MKIGDRVKIPTKQSIGPCNAARCNAVIGARMYRQDSLLVANIRDDERGTIVTCSGGDGINTGYSDFMLSDLEIYE